MFMHYFQAEELESSSKNPSLETIESQTKNVSEAARVDLKVFYFNHG